MKGLNADGGGDTEGLCCIGAVGEGIDIRWFTFCIMGDWEGDSSWDLMGCLAAETLK